jgi:hypothetical protein
MMRCASTLAHLIAEEALTNDDERVDAALETVR